MWTPIIVCTAWIFCGPWPSEWRGHAYPTESECRWMAEEIIRFTDVTSLRLQFRCEKQ
jgi:hypothetical protein